MQLLNVILRTKTTKMRKIRTFVDFNDKFVLILVQNALFFTGNMHYS